MDRYVLIAKAWPYANGPLHIGHLAGLLGADILARYFRLAGDHVLFVSGTDCHGTPIINRAVDEGIKPEDVVKKYHEQFTKCFERLGFTHDLYTLTYTPEHHEMVKQYFKRLYDMGHLVPRSEIQLFCDNCNQFLVDRLVEGECPFCQKEGARGDQCEACGKTYEAIELLDPRCKKCDQAAKKRESEHLYFNLPKFQDQLWNMYSEEKEKWRENAQTVTRNWLAHGLHDRAVTRDLEWGVDVPIDGFEGKKIYVWFDAVLGYLTTSIKHCGGDLEGGEWTKWWLKENNPLHYYVHGKDNIPFHTIIFPAMLMGFNRVNAFALPTHVISSEYLNLPAGKKFSKSSGYGVTLLQFFEMVDNIGSLEIDSMRFFLTMRGPEVKDSHFSWEELVTLHNAELANKFSNLVNRVLKLVSKNFSSEVPEAVDRSNAETLLMDSIQATYNVVGDFIENGEFRNACQAVIELIRKTNNLIDTEEPWKEVEKNPQKTKNTINTALQVITNLRIMLKPFVPFACERLSQALNLSDVNQCWDLQLIPVDWKLQESVHIFSRIKREDLPDD